MSKYFQETKPYESIFSNERDGYSPKKKRNKDDDDDDSDYDPNWVENF